MRKTIALVFVIVGIFGFLIGVGFVWYSPNYLEAALGALFIGIVIILFSLISFCVGANRLKRMREESLSQGNWVPAKGLNVYQIIIRICIVIYILMALFIVISYSGAVIHNSQNQPVRGGP